MKNITETYHPITRAVTDLLNRNGCPYRTFEHDPVATSEEAARVRPGFSLQQGAKALIVRIKGPDKATRFEMLVFPANLKFDSRKAKAALETKDMRFATVDEVADLTGGVEVGGVPPFGNLFGLEVIVDRRLFDNEWIVFNAGDRRFSVAMRSADYRELVNPRVADIV